MKYRKKPVIIEAVQLQVGEKSQMQILEFTKGHATLGGNGRMVIPTMEGEMMANIGDFIIKGLKGEFYPCKPDIFEATYEKVEE